MPILEGINSAFFPLDLQVFLNYLRHSFLEALFAVIIIIIFFFEISVNIFFREFFALFCFALFFCFFAVSSCSTCKWLGDSVRLQIPL